MSTDRHPTAAWWLLAALGSVLAALLLVRLLGGPFDQVHSSTGAWILAHVSRVLLVGDYRAAASASAIRNTSYDPLYPAVVAGLGALVAPESTVGIVRLGHVVAAGCLGLAALPLFALWRAVGGTRAGVVGAVAVLLPPVVATAALARYDVPAYALVLTTGAVAWKAGRSRRVGWWAVVGALAAATHLAREYLLVPALSAAGVAWLGLVVGTARRRLRRDLVRVLLPSLLLGLLGLGLVGGIVPWSLGLSPLAGLEAMLGYGMDPEARPRGLGEVAGWPAMAVPGSLGLVGIGLALRRARDRLALAVLLAMLLPFPFFWVSRQQSPQYYVLGLMLLTGGSAGVVPAGRRAGTLVAAGLATALLGWTVVETPRVAAGLLDSPAAFHSEAWPAESSEVAAAADWLVAAAGSRPVFVVSSRIENFDALVEVQHGRPVAHLFSRELGVIDEFAQDYGVSSVLVAMVEESRYQPESMPDATLIERHSEGRLTVSLYEHALKPMKRVDQGVCRRRSVPRGVCAQADWLHGGEAALVEGIRKRSARYGPLLGFEQ